MMWETRQIYTGPDPETAKHWEERLHRAYEEGWEPMYITSWPFGQGPYWCYHLKRKARKKPVKRTPEIVDLNVAYNIPK